MIAPTSVRPMRDLVGDHLARGAQAAEQAELVVARPAGERRADDARAGEREEVEEPDVEVDDLQLDARDPGRCRRAAPAQELRGSRCRLDERDRPSSRRVARRSRACRRTGRVPSTTSAGKNEMIGARLCRNLSAFGGMKSSLKIVFRPSAAGWSRPSEAQADARLVRICRTRVDRRRATTTSASSAAPPPYVDVANCRRAPSRSEQARDEQTPTCATSPP